jgi:hypothetical protein
MNAGGTPQVTFDDYVAMSGAVPVMGMEGMLRHYGLTPSQWTMIAGPWNSVMATNPQYAQFGAMVEQEAARIRSGGIPRPVSLGGAPRAAGPLPAPNPYPSAQPNPYAQQQAYDNSPEAVGAQVGSALHSFGNAMNSFFEGAVGAMSVGTRVMVQWSDGRRYPATVTNSQAGQLEVAFPDGRRVWMPQVYVSII